MNIASPIASALSLLNPAFLAIPVIAGVCNEIWGWNDASNIEKRLLEFQKALDEKNIEMEEFRNKVNILEEHDQYVLRNNVRYLCISALPETTDALIDSMIDLIMKEEQHGINEEVCEILQEFNAIDIKLMRMIKDYRGTNLQEEVQFSHVITWNEFLKNCLKIDDPLEGTAFLISRITREDGSENYDYACYVRSLLKMQKIGVVNIYLATTLGRISQNNIDCFLVTLFGEQVLEHIK